MICLNSNIKYQYSIYLNLIFIYTDCYPTKPYSFATSS